MGVFPPRGRRGPWLKFLEDQNGVAGNARCPFYTLAALEQQREAADSIGNLESNVSDSIGREEDHDSSEGLRDDDYHDDDDYSAVNGIKRKEGDDFDPDGPCGEEVVWDPIPLGEIGFIPDVWLVVCI